MAAFTMLLLPPENMALFLGELRQPAQGRDELPDLFLAPRGAEGRHAGHADSIRNDPFELAVRASLNARQGEARGRRVEARACLRGIDPRSAVASDAVSPEQGETRGHSRGFAGQGVGFFGGVARDGT